MEYPGVMIECKWNNNEAASCSGMLLCNNYILTHGSLLYSLLKDRFDFSKVEFTTEMLSDDIFSSTSYYAHINSEIILNDMSKFRQNSPIIKSEGYESDSNIAHQSTSELFEKRLESKSDRECTCLDAYPEVLFINQSMARDIVAIFSPTRGWKFSEDEFASNIGEARLLSSFIIFRIGRIGCLVDCLSKAAMNSCIPEKGDLVLIDSCPFGNISTSMFLSSLTSGIVSNCNSSRTLFISDARCVMGCEGSPVYARCNKSFGVCGFVIAPFSWINGEWLGLTLVGSAKIIFNAMIFSLTNSSGEDSLYFCKDPKNRLLKGNDSWRRTIDVRKNAVNNDSIDPDERQITSIFDTISFNSGLQFKDNMKRIINSTVGIISGEVTGRYNWGSGVIVDAQKGIIVTCSHVTLHAVNKSVTILLSSGTKVKGRVVYETYPMHVVRELKSKINFKFEKDKFDLWDLAIVVSEHNFETGLPMAEKIPIEGSPVFLCGYGLFDINQSEFSSSLSAGIITKINCHSKRSEETLSPKFNQSDLQLHSGNNESCTIIANKHTLMGTKHTGYDSNEFDYSKKSIPENFWVHEPSDERTRLVALQSSCSVYEGNSGGPLVAIHESKGPMVVGIMVCSAKNHEGKGSFPQINMAVPSCAIAKAVNRFSISGDVRDLSPLSAKSDQERLLWSSELKDKSKL